MPELFDPNARPSPVGARRNVTVTTSIAIHIVLVLLVIVVPLVGGVSLPAAMSRMDAFVAPSAVPTPPPPQAPSSQPARSAVNPNAAPLHSPDTIAPENPLPPAPGIPQVPGGLPVGSGYAVGPITGTGPAILAKPPEPERRAPVRPGGKIGFPKRMSFVAPVYPAIAQAARVEGTVILEAIIDETGAVTDLRVLRSVPLLDAAAKEAVLKWRYSPTTLNGVRVPVVMTVTVTFTLK